jgi:hypothetical protein
MRVRFILHPRQEWRKNNGLGRLERLWSKVTTVMKTIEQKIKNDIDI